MGSSKRNLLTSILLLVVMGFFAVLTIFIVVDAINKKYYNDIKVEYEVQEESPNIILTFARNEGSNFSTDNTKVVLNEDKTKFRIDGTVPTIENGVVTNLDDLTSSDGREFYFFSTNSSFIDPQEDPENPDFIFSETDSRYYVSTEDNPIWYDVPESSENLTLYSVFLTPNVHNSDFEDAPINTITNVIVSHDVVDLPANAFSGSWSTSSALTTILLPENLQGLGEGAFFYCSSLTSITIPDSVTSIGEYAFRDCTSLKTVTFGDNSKLERIEDGTFYGCNNFISIEIPSSVKYMGSDVFCYCGKLKSVTFEENSQLEVINGTFATQYPLKSFTTIAIPKSVKRIGDSSQLTSIGNRVFYNCSSLTSITIPESVTSIGEYAFYYCSSLTSITIPGPVTSIGRHAFRYCDNLKIYCEAESEPSGWDSSWNSSNRPVYWAGEWEMVDGVPVPIESGVEGVGYSDVGEDFGIGFDGLGFREELYFNDKRERKVV